ncbi:MAG: alpha/beta hydrolase [Pirellulaceae bacterium]
MNRIKLGPLAKMAELTSADSTAADISAAELIPDDRTTPLHDIVPQPAAAAACSWFIPLHFESRHAYPLIVWMHSGRNSARQLDQVLPLISERNYLGVSVQGTEHLGNQQFGWLQSADAIETTIHHVRHAIESAAARFHIHPERVYIAGRGTGGTMAFRVAFACPELFAGVASFNGSLPSNLNPLGRWRTCRRIPVFWAHGRKSDTFPESNLCHQLRLLHVGGFNVTLRQYPCADQLIDRSYSDLNVWVMDQIAATGESGIVS